MNAPGPQIACQGVRLGIRDLGLNPKPKTLNPKTFWLKPKRPKDTAPSKGADSNKKPKPLTPGLDTVPGISWSRRL